MFELADYLYDLPSDRIAQTPCSPRDASRLMVLDRRKGTIEHTRFSEIGEYLDPGDALVANHSKVLAARFLGHRIFEDGTKGGKIEFLLLREESDEVYEGLFHASAKHRPGVRFQIENLHDPEQPLIGEIVRGASESEHGTVGVKFDQNPIETGLGLPPLPPYIRRDGLQAKRDSDTYQTVYAETSGSAAAPTAGLHFTSKLIEKLRSSGISWEKLWLHVGLGTFRGVKASDIREHQIHKEAFEIDVSVGKRLIDTKRRRGRVVAVGTTSLRALESAWSGKELATGRRETDLYLYPGGPHSIRFVDALVTNFHLPGSTLLMLVCLFAGRDYVMKAYLEAIREKYRFYSYGDAMLII